MSGFRDMVAADNYSVFLCPEEFAETRSVRYDGVVYSDIPVVLSGIREKDRRQMTVTDHAQGLYLASAVLHCAAADLDGAQPEKGQRMAVSDGGFFREFYVAASVCELGMLRVELEAIDE